MEKNWMTLEFSAVSKNESFARMAVGVFFSQLNPTLEELADVKTAISEAVTNCVVHAYQQKGGTIRIDCVLEGDHMTVTVTDTGIGIPDVEKAMQPFFTTMPGEERSGMGFTVMQSFMDGLSVTTSPNEGTVVTMEKKVASQAAPTGDEAIFREGAVG
ncbi:anti-sigma F factor [Eubacteriales bacterium OttesenSCG-928-M02]|nr:anti-sigma F factor [Eubacteriales bacterium OttesenSCG-928-M02]